jgi:hypothetical protein
MTFGCLMPMIRPHSDRSSEISQPASSYWASWWILFGLGCTIIRFTRVLFLPPPSRRRAQWEGVNGALLSHILHVSARIPTTPLPSKVSLLWEWRCDQHNQPSWHVKKKRLRNTALSFDSKKGHILQLRQNPYRGPVKRSCSLQTPENETRYEKSEYSNHRELVQTITSSYMVLSVGNWICPKQPKGSTSKVAAGQSEGSTVVV